jgi:molybdopterin synthase catalytic subunit
MANPVCEVLLTEAALNPSAHDAVGSGAVLDFLGVVRPMEQGREISGIDYEAHHAMATHQMEQIAGEATSKFGLDSVLIHHRVGFVNAGEASVFVRTTSRNRAESYRANAWIMDELKKKVPIWKRPQFKASGQMRADKAEPVSSR